MSIINEALKKAAREKGNILSRQYQPVVKTGLRPEIEGKKFRVNWGPLFVLLVLFLITGPIIAPIFSSPFKAGGLGGNPTAAETGSALKTGSETDLASLPASVDSINRKSQFGIEEASVFQGMAQQPNFQGMASQSHIIQTPYLKLSGIVYSSDVAYCIINDKIIRIGDDVQGAKLIKVTPKKAILEYQGEQVVLSTSQAV